MGNELSLACSEAAQQSVLLAGIRTRVSNSPPIHRDKRKKSTTAITRAKRCSTKASPSKSKTGAKSKVSNGSASKRQGSRQHDKNRKQDRGAKGKDKTIGRSSAELGIEWVGSYCPDGSPHFFISNRNIYEGSLFKCQKCSKHKWLPMQFNEAVVLESLMNRHGTATGYCKYLDEHREAKILVSKLQDLWYARKRISNDKDFLKLVVSIMEDKEYDKEATNAIP